MKINYKIYQLNLNNELYGKSIHKEDYTETELIKLFYNNFVPVWKDEVKIKENMNEKSICEEIYKDFNIHAYEYKNYAGRNFTVSSVLAITINNITKYYYCNMTDWVLLFEE